MCVPVNVDCCACRQLWTRVHLQGVQALKAASRILGEGVAPGRLPQLHTQAFKVRWAWLCAT